MSRGGISGLSLSHYIAFYRSSSHDIAPHLNALLPISFNHSAPHPSCNATFTVDLSMWLKLPQDQKDYFPCPKCNVRVSVPLRNIGYIPQWRLQTLEQDLPVSFEELK